LLLDPEDAMTPPLARYLANKLEQELIRRRWRIVALDVQEDYVNLLTEIPDEANVRAVIPDLMHFSADVVHEFDPDLDPNMLWADTYLVQRGDTPLDVLEIQDFINFVRE
ncbi:MAG: transposase, partial [Anaerolineae bacterium]|nr:transposase [Anaerolineae bacterium]